MKFLAALSTHLVLWLLFLTISAIVGAFCWTYTINTWLLFFGKIPSVVWWQGAIIGFVPWVGQASIPPAEA